MYPQFEGKEVIFVFGSNLAGRHGAGAALHARNFYGAIYGRGRGIQNKSYAIPTKGYDMKPLPLQGINAFVDEFIEYAMTCLVNVPDRVFRVTAIGTGYAGYTHQEIAPMFMDSPSNCFLPFEWQAVLRSLGAEVDPRRFIRR